MSTATTTRQAASLSAGHPLSAILVQQAQADVTDPAASAAAGSSGALLMAGAQDFGALIQGGGGSGLTAAGIAAVTSAYNTYVSGLSTAKRAQTGFLRAIVTSSGMAVSVHAADIASFAATLQTALNNASNFGLIGS